MPVMDGHSATIAIRTLPEGGEVPIIAMTAYQQAREIEMLFEAGCTDYVLKPIKKKLILEKVSKTLDERQRRSGSKSSPVESGDEGNIDQYGVQTDYAGAHAMVDSDLADVIPAFLKNRRDDVEEIKRLLASDDETGISEIRKIGHRMKGTGGGYGFYEISKIGKDIVDAAEARDKKALERLNNSLSRYISMVKVSVRRD
jgi:response regulator RpfG family c-di-GMP phosphodiesterase